MSLFPEFFLCILDSACRYISDKPAVIVLLHVIHEQELASCGISRNYDLNWSISSHWGWNFFFFVLCLCLR